MIFHYAYIDWFFDQIHEVLDKICFNLCRASSAVFVHLSDFDTYDVTC